jgi:P27 family predicted phage terminase small subunit
MRGRKPKPTHLKLVRNNPGRRPLNRHEPSAPRDEPECPAHLTEAAREHWVKITAILRRMGILSSADGDVIALYCAAHSRWVLAERRMAELGVVMKAPKSGVIMQSIFLAIANRAMAQMKELGDILGLSPQARARLAVLAPPPADDPYFD